MHCMHDSQSQQSRILNQRAENRQIWIIIFNLSRRNFETSFNRNFRGQIEHIL